MWRWCSWRSTPRPTPSVRRGSGARCWPVSAQALPGRRLAGRAGQVRTPGLSAPGRDRAQITPGKGVTLAAEPVALTKMAAGAGPEAALAADVVAKINWTGKPVPKTPPLAPLTAEEQKRFESGKTLYATRCAGCHGAEGEGKEKVAALANSKWVNAPVGLPDSYSRQRERGSDGHDAAGGEAAQSTNRSPTC